MASNFIVKNGRKLAVEVISTKLYEKQLMRFYGQRKELRKILLFYHQSKVIAMQLI